MNSFDLTPFTYLLQHIKNLEKFKHGKCIKNTKFITR